MALLEISDLRIAFSGSQRPAVDGVDLDVPQGARVGIIGESGSGKSVTAMSILRLNDERIMSYGADSRVIFDGQNMLSSSPSQLTGIRGKEISMIFQDPMSVLNPVFTVGRQIQDVLRAHLKLPRTAARTRAIASLDEVGIRDPGRVYRQYPHELSGGMRQRVMIAMAIAAQPRMLIADEPTSALDVTVQAAILDTLAELVSSRGMSTLIITHDMGVVARFCDTVHVMHNGQVVESGLVTDVLTKPTHEYTRSLLAAVPRLHS